jgi:hypothetical protein
MLSRRDSSPWRPAKLSIRARTLAVSAANQHHVERLQGSELEALARLAARLGEDGIELRGCFNCLRYAPPEAAGGPSRGGCRLASRLGPPALPLEFGCGEHLRAPGWPDDLHLLARSRAQLHALDGQPSRLAAFEGALLGSSAASPTSVRISPSRWTASSV